MAVKIGHASLDERKKIKGGQVGDQTGGEVCVRTHYNGGWDFVLRPKTAELAEKSAQACERGCANQNIGYDQNQRNTLHTQAQKVNFDLSKITTPCECDCSSFMHVCAIAGGCKGLGYGTNGYTTRTMGKAFVASGEYEKLTDRKYLTSDKYLKRGDILVRAGHHTVMVLENGSAISATGNPYNEPTRVLYRRIPMMRGNDVKWLQYELVRHGCLAATNAKGQSNIDGKLGNDTANAIGRFQEMVGIKVDKKCGPVTREYLKK